MLLFPEQSSDFLALFVHVTFSLEKTFLKPYHTVCLALYSKQLRRTFFGIIKSVGHMFDIILFFVIITLIYAAIGIKIIGDLGGTDYDKVYFG